MRFIPQRLSRSASVLLTTIFTVFALSLGVMLLLQLRESWVNLRDAERTEILAGSDRALYRAGQEIRLSRGDAQTVL